MNGSGWSVSRRSFVVGGLSAAAWAVSVSNPAGAEASRVPTARQTAGPFYPRTKPIDSDADLVSVAGRTERARGIVTRVAGRVLDPGGRAVPDALVEIWQCDALGRYHHPRGGGGRDPNFQGYGRVETDGSGGYAFRTIRPVPYPGRTPHIHFAVSARDFPVLTTQMYVAGEPLNDEDFVLNAIRDPEARAGVIVDLVPAPGDEPGSLTGTFDIVLGRG